MTLASWLQLAALIVFIVVGTRLLGPYIAGIYRVTDELPTKRPFGDRVFSPIERLIYRLSGVDEDREQRWSVYALSLLAFSLLSVLLVYAVRSASRDRCPWNPNGVGGVPAPLSFNTAVSFVTNTNWQNYSGESTMSHLTQMAGLAVQNFVSAAVGLCVLIALIRGLVRRRSATIGNFWVDLVRGTVRLMLPLAVRLRHRLRQPGRGAEPARQHLGDHGRGVDPGDPGRDDRQPGGDQGAGHERRRLRQRQLVPSVREPQRPDQLARRWAPSCSSRSPSPTPSAGGRGPEAGLGRLRRHVHPLDRARPRWPWAWRSHGNPELTARGADQSVTVHPDRREHGGQGGPLRRSDLRALRRHHHGHLERRGRLPARLHDARWAACRRW